MDQKSQIKDINYLLGLIHEECLYALNEKVNKNQWTL